MTMCTGDEYLVLYCSTVQSNPLKCGKWSEAGIFSFSLIWDFHLLYSYKMTIRFPSNCFPKVVAFKWDFYLSGSHLSGFHRIRRTRTKAGCKT